MLQQVVDTLLGVTPWVALLIIAGLVFAEAALFSGFVLPGETAVMPALAGASRMEYPRFLVFNAIGRVLWGTACVLPGYFAAHSIGRVTHYLGLTSGVIVGLLLLGLFWTWHRRHRDG
jgi:membrane-associated protein